MSELLHDSIWQFVGTVVAFAAIIISIGLYLKQRQYKSLSYKIISYTSVMSVNEDVKDRIKILFDDHPVGDVFLCVIELKNTGKLPIIRDDYESPVEFYFGERAKLLLPDVIDTKPKGLPAKIRIQKDCAMLEPLLLNSGDSIFIKLLASGKGDLKVSCRVRGVTEIARAISPNRSVYFTRPIMLGLEIGFALLGAGVAFLISSAKPYGTVTVGVFFISLSVLTLIAVIWLLAIQTKRTFPP